MVLFFNTLNLQPTIRLFDCSFRNEGQVQSTRLNEECEAEKSEAMGAHCGRFLHAQSNDPSLNGIVGKLGRKDGWCGVVVGEGCGGRL